MILCTAFFICKNHSKFIPLSQYIKDSSKIGIIFNKEFITLERNVIIKLYY